MVRKGGVTDIQVELKHWHRSVLSEERPHRQSSGCCCRKLSLQTRTQSQPAVPPPTAEEEPAASSTLQQLEETKRQAAVTGMKLIRQVAKQHVDCLQSQFNGLLSTLPLNRPATVEGSEGKGAWCERCWATLDTGPQKESDVTGSREGDRGEKRGREGRRKRANKKKRLPRPDRSTKWVTQAGRRHLTLTDV